MRQAVANVERNFQRGRRYRHAQRQRGSRQRLSRGLRVNESLTMRRNIVAESFDK